MKYFIPLVIILLAISCVDSTMKYPETRKDQVVDTFYNKVVEDPYRWLEDDNALETKQWVDAQNELTFDYLKDLPRRDEIKQRLTELWDYPKNGTPFNVSGRWFMFKNNGLQNQYVLFTFDDLLSEPYVLLDPNKLSEDGTVAFSGMDVSPDGKYLVYKIARSGSDWNEIYVKNIETGELTNDHIEWVKFSGLSCYNNGFFYSAYDKPTKGNELKDASMFQKIYFHQYGDEQTNDKLIFSNKDNAKRMYTASVDEERKFLFIYENESTSGNGLYIAELGGQKLNPIKLADGFEYDFKPIEVVGNKVLIRTNYNAPKYKVIAIDLDKPSMDNWVDIIPEKDKTLQGGSMCGGKLFVEYMVDASSRLEVYLPDGKYQGEVDLPGICNASGLQGTKYDDTAFYSYSSFNTPGTIFKYNVETGNSEVYFEPELKFNPNDFVVKQEFYASKDGTNVPLFIFHKKGVEKNGENPTMLYAYGGFNVSITPSFSVTTLAFVEQGGVYAIANIRGGGEYGEEWHKAGTKMNKQNVFDDFIAGAEFLIESGYTSSDHLSIRGGSNGGLLIGAVANQRPDLFKVALPAVGVMDMLRYQKFTIGYAWAGDYGTVDDSEEMFNYLLGYSPVHNVEAKDYPAIMVTTADHDDRVVPAHSFKYISRVQELNTGELPTLIRIDVKAGHGSGKPTAKVIEEYVDLFSFVFYHTK